MPSICDDQQSRLLFFRYRITSKMLSAMLSSKLQKNKFIGLLKFETAITNNYLIMAKSFEDYVNGTPISKTRRRNYVMTNVFMIMNAIRFGIIVLYDKPWLLVELGEFLHVFYNKIRILAFLMFMCHVVVLADQAAFFYVERHRKFVIMDIFHQMITKNRVEGMSVQLANKLLVNAYLISKVIIEYQVKCITLLVCMITPIMLYQAYNSDISHSPFRLVVSGLNFILLVRQGFTMAMCTTFLFVIIMMYLKFTFMQSLDTIDKSIKQKKYYNQALIEHKQFSDLLEQFSPLINSVIGNLNNLNPIVIIISMQIMLEKDLALWKRIYIANLFIATALCGFFINKLATWIPFNNSHIPTIIYPICCDKVPRSLRHMLRIEELLSSLNQKFLGFYSYNMFEVTKLSFYKYLFGLSITYMITMKTINNM